MNSVSDVISPDDTSNFLLIECRERGGILTNLKLQKLLYYTQAWHLVIHSKPLFSEDFHAWIHGPALPSQYQRFKKFECQPILEGLSISHSIEEGVVNHLVEIVNVFGIETASALELMTHNEQPWIAARNEISEYQASSAIISKESMLSFYKSLI